MGVALMRSVAPAIQTAEERGAALMKRVEYRLMESSADREAIYRLRYNAYLKEGSINPNPSGLLIDRFDDNQEHPPYDPKTTKRDRKDDERGKIQGGNLRGLIRRLDYIRNLGCTAIWLSPPFKNRQDDQYAHHGYAIVAVGLSGQPGDGLHWRRLAPLLRARGIAPPPRHLLRPDVTFALQSAKLATFLANYDLPADEQGRWRV